METSQPTIPADMHKELKNVDQVLEALGPLGLFSIVQCFVYFLSFLPDAFQLFSFIFTGQQVVHRCARPDNVSVDLIAEMYGNLSNDVNVTYGQCNIVVSRNISNDVMEKSHPCLFGFEYEGGKDMSIISEFDLVCENEALAGFPMMFLNLGIGVGSFVGPPFSDLYGRKRMVIVSGVTLLIGVITLGLAPHYAVFIAAKFIVGIFQVGSSLSTVTASLELFPSRYRGFSGGFISTLLWAICIMSLAPVAFLLRFASWRVQELTYAGASLVVIIQAVILLEPLHWLAANKKTKEIMTLIKIAAKWNQKDLASVLSVYHENQSQVAQEDCKASVGPITVFNVQEDCKPSIGPITVCNVQEDCKPSIGPITVCNVQEDCKPSVGPITLCNVQEDCKPSVGPITVCNVQEDCKPSVGPITVCNVQEDCKPSVGPITVCNVQEDCKPSVGPIIVCNVQEDCKPSAEPTTVCNVQEDCKPSAEPTVCNVQEETLSYKDLLKNRHLRTNLLASCFIWFINSLAYFASYLTSSSLAGNLYLNFFLVALSEGSSSILIFVMLKRLQRKQMLAVFHVIAGIGLIASSVCFSFQDSHSLKILGTVFSLTGIVGVTGNVNSYFLYTPEIFPTNLRNRAVGMTYAFATLGGMLASFSSILTKYALWAPGTIFGVTSLMAVALLQLMPESKGRELPQTLHDLEAWRKKAKPT